MLVNEDENTSFVLPFSKQFHQSPELVIIFQNLNCLLNILGSLSSIAHDYLYRMDQYGPGQIFNGAWKSCAEQYGLLVRSTILQHHLDLGLETHVKDSVCFIQDDVAHSSQVGDFPI